MDKQRKWNLFLILTVIALTIYNIMPTIFYYTKPLSQPIGEERAKELSSSISERVSQLKPESVEWVHSFCELLHIKPVSVTTDPILTIRFSKPEEAARFRNYFPRAGSLIPFAPAQLSLIPQNVEEKDGVV